MTAYAPPVGSDLEGRGRAGLEERTLHLLYDLFVCLRGEAWEASLHAWLTPTQMAILRVLARAKRPMCPADIARALGCSRPTVSRSVANLEQKAFVFREADPHDRRRRLVIPRRAGLGVSGWGAQWGRDVPGGLRVLTGEELRDLRRTLDLVVGGVRYRRKRRR